MGRHSQHRLDILTACHRKCWSCWSHPKGAPPFFVCVIYREIAKGNLEIRFLHHMQMSYDHRPTRDHWYAVNWWLELHQCKHCALVLPMRNTISHDCMPHASSKYAICYYVLRISFCRRSKAERGGREKWKVSFPKSQSVPILYDTVYTKYLYQISYIIIPVGIGIHYHSSNGTFGLWLRLRWFCPSPLLPPASRGLQR